MRAVGPAAARQHRAAVRKPALLVEERMRVALPVAVAEVERRAVARSLAEHPAADQSQDHLAADQTPGALPAEHRAAGQNPAEPPAEPAHQRREEQPPTLCL